ncbi:MAG: hypothetical protein LBU32_03970 [Clostridiales bacterium]|jgi:hypothetical protein|nr:hypothetical protein [Clostridiales bacterium]
MSLEIPAKMRMPKVGDAAFNFSAFSAYHYTAKKPWAIYLFKVKRSYALRYKHRKKANYKNA